MFTGRDSLFIIKHHTKTSELIFLLAPSTFKSSVLYSRIRAIMSLLFMCCYINKVLCFNTYMLLLRSRHPSTPGPSQQTKKRKSSVPGKSPTCRSILSFFQKWCKKKKSFFELFCIFIIIITRSFWTLLHLHYYHYQKFLFLVVNRSSN